MATESLSLKLTADVSQATSGVKGFDRVVEEAEQELQDLVRALQDGKVSAAGFEAAVGQVEDKVKAAKKAFDVTDEQARRLDKTIGDSGRNVGDYTGKIDRLEEVGGTAETRFVGLASGIDGVTSLMSDPSPQEFAQALGDLGDVTEHTLAPALGAARDGLKNMLGNLSALKGVLVAGGITAGLVGIAVAFSEIEKNRAAEQIDELTLALRRNDDVNTDVLEKLLITGAAFGDLEERLREVAQVGGLQAAERLVELAEATGLPQEAMETLRAELSELRPELSDTASAFDAVSDAIRGQNDALMASVDPVFAAIDASAANEEAKRREADATQAVTDAAAEFGRGSPEHVQALADLEAAHRDAASAAFDDKAATDELAVGLSTGAIKVDDLEARLAELESQGYGSAASAQWLRQKIEEIKSKHVTLTTSGFGEAIQAAQTLHGTLSRLPESKTIKLGFSSFGVAELNRFSALAEFQHGGRVPGPVGQPRLILAHGGETVVPTHSSAEMARFEHLTSPVPHMVPASSFTGVGGGASVNVNLGPVTVVANDPQAVTEGLLRNIRQNGAGQVRRALGI